MACGMVIWVCHVGVVMLDINRLKCNSVYAVRQLLKVCFKRMN